MTTATIVSSYDDFTLYLFEAHHNGVQVLVLDAPAALVAGFPVTAAQMTKALANSLAKAEAAAEQALWEPALPPSRFPRPKMPSVDGLQALHNARRRWPVPYPRKQPGAALRDSRRLARQARIRGYVSGH